MSLRAAKRQKREHTPSIPASSDALNNGVDTYRKDLNEDERETDGAGGERTKKTRKISRRGTAAPAPKGEQTATSPAKARSTACLSHRSKTEHAGRLRQGALDFSKARERQGPGKNGDGTKSPSASPLKTAHAAIQDDLAELEDDLIQDDENDREYVSDKHRMRTVRIGQVGRLDTTGSKSGSTSGSGIRSRQHSPRKGSGNRRVPFSMADLHTSSAKGPDDPRQRYIEAGVDSLPWAQRYPPTDLEELGVHKRKVADVRAWIDNVLKGYERKVGL